MNVRHALAAVLLIAFTGCAEVAQDDAQKRDVVRDAIADEDAARSEMPRTISEPHVLINDYSAFAWQGWASWDSWLQARQRFETFENVSHIRTAILGPMRIYIRGRSASVVVNDGVSYRKDGRVSHERGIEVFSLNGFGGTWRVEGMARLNAGVIAQGPDAEKFLHLAHVVIQSLNTEHVVPAQLVDTVLIEDDLQDWQQARPEGDIQDPHKAPLMPGDPDMQIVLGKPLRLVIGRSDAFAVFSAELRSKATGALKGRGRLGLVLGESPVSLLGGDLWHFEAIAWAPH